ncbi:MAG TPA: TetR/AcrR family transcriptional regulator [Thermoanaerobaculia bacterium]|nr:TetR/AcrR family transcriptional regulator [Thermoanaerobaculia bacterium]
MGPRERREREREEVRTRILDAARELFANEGFEAVTMRRIADRIEYSPTAIYFHFRDKEALLKELCDHDFGALAHRFTDIARIPDTIERLRQTGYAYAQFGIDYPNHYRLMFMTPHPPIDPADQELERGNPEEDAYAFLKLIVAEAVATGRFREGFTDADLIAQTIWAGMHGVISLHIAKCNDGWVDWRPLEDRTRSMVGMIIDGFTR